MQSSKLAMIGLIAALIALVSSGPAGAATEMWVSANGSDTNPCTIAMPCATLSAALSAVQPGGTIFCIEPNFVIGPLTISKDVTIDCSGSSYAVPASALGGLGITISGSAVTLRGLAIYGTELPPSFVNTIGINITGNGTVRLEKCKIFGFTTAGIEVVPSAGSVTLIIQDSSITKNNAGILVAPTGSASVSIAIDRSSIDSNTGGGLKAVTASGTINGTISDSSLSFNGGNGLNAVGNSSAQNMIVLTRDSVTSNGAAGVQANGATSAVLVNNTLLDSNAAGATSIVNGGRVLTYGNNSIVGPAGFGFTGSATLQ